MMRYKLFLILPSLFAFTLLFPSFTSAQVQTPVSGEEILNSTNFVVIPSIPQPNQSVSVTLEATGINLNSSTIIWSVNNQRVESGVGKKSISFTTGDIGNSYVIKATVSNSEKTLNRSITIRPGSVDILWQGNSYTPPFYKGRALWPRQGELLLTAVPNVVNSGGVYINPKNLIYKWSKNGVILGSLSGYGKSSLVLNDSGLGINMRIGIDVLEGEKLVARGFTDLTPSNSMVLVYENSPLYGYIWENEVGNRIGLNKEEIALSAFPYFFSEVFKDSGLLNYQWKINNGFQTKGGNETLYRVPESSSGKSLISVSAKNVTKISQGASKDFLIEFNNKNEF